MEKSSQFFMEIIYFHKKKGHKWVYMVEVEKY